MPPKTNQYLKWDGMKYPTYEVEIGNKPFITTSPYIVNGDTVFTAKPKGAPNSAYEVVVAQPEGRRVETLEGDSVGVPDNKTYEEFLKKFGVAPKKMDEGGVNKPVFEGNTFNGHAYVRPNGDTLRYFHTTDAAPGELYEVKYISSPGENKPRLHTKKETGELFAGNETVISRTSNWGKTIDETFAPYMEKMPIESDYSQKPWYKKILYTLVGYKNGGKLNYLSIFK